MGTVNDWIWLAAMLLFGLQMFILGTSVNPEKFPQPIRSFWWGLTHPFGPPAPWWSEQRRVEWLDDERGAR